MSTEAQQQIAREARDEIREYFDKPLFLLKTTAGADIVLNIILSAIEQATADLAKELKLTTTQLAIERHEAAQPQHSENDPHPNQ